MKVVTWNIDFKTDKSKLWDYIDKEINPDILLLQECRNFPSIYQGIGEHIGGTRSWGSVVLSRQKNRLKIRATFLCINSCYHELIDELLS